MTLDTKQITKQLLGIGLAISSRGEPLLRADDLPRVIDGWLEWERDKIEVELV